MERAVNNAHRGRQTRDGIRIYEPSDHAGMQAAGRLAATILDAAGQINSRRRDRRSPCALLRELFQDHISRAKVRLVSHGRGL